MTISIVKKLERDREKNFSIDRFSLDHGTGSASRRVTAGPKSVTTAAPEPGASAGLKDDEESRGVGTVAVPRCTSEQSRAVRRGWKIILAGVPSCVFMSEHVNSSQVTDDQNHDHNNLTV